MKRCRKLLRIKLQQVSSFLLICLFLCISAAQLFDTHHDTHEDAYAQCGDKEQIQASDKCAVCNYYLHTQGKQVFLYYPPVFASAVPKAITINTLVFTGNYKFTLQGFTNKGPPNKA